MPGIQPLPYGETQERTAQPADNRGAQKCEDRTLPQETLLRNKKEPMCGLWARSREDHEAISVQTALTRPCLDEMARETKQIQTEVCISFPDRSGHEYPQLQLFSSLYGCETWSLTLREEHSLRAFESRVLKRIFGPKRDEVTGEWRKLHNEELHDLYSSPSIIRIMKSRRMRWAGNVARMAESRNAYRLLVGKPEAKRPLRRPRRRWVDIRMDLLELGWDNRNWIGLAQDRNRWRALVNSVLNLPVP
jgi:hypothetical protein